MESTQTNELFSEKFRPQLHFTPERNWINDPNGLLFYKGKYHMGSDPTKDPNLDVILNDESSKKFCTWFYATKLNEIKEKYKLDY